MRRKTAVLLCVCTAALLTGCYDSREIDTLANVIAVGAELAAQDRCYTFAIADIGSFGSDSGDGSKSGIICCSSKAGSIEEAVEEVNSRLSKKLSFSHMSVIIFSKAFAKNGVYKITDYFESLPETRPQTLTALSGEKPSELLEKLSPQLEVNSEKYFLNVLQKSESYIPVLKISDLKNASMTGEDMLAPVISFPTEGEELTEKDITADKIAVLSEGKYRFDLDDGAAAGLLNGTKDVPVDLNGARYIVRSVKPPKVNIENSVSAVDVGIELFLGGERLDASSAELLSQKIADTLGETSGKGCDIYGFADRVRQKFYLWRTYSAYDWKSRITRANYKVKITTLGG